MAKVQRVQTVKVETEERTRDVTLKVWSFGKLLQISRKFKDLLSEAFQGFDFEKSADIEAIRKAAEVLLSEDVDMTFLIKVSLKDVKEWKEDEILEWLPGDFLEVVGKILEMNLTDDLLKKFQALLANEAVKAVRAGSAVESSSKDPGSTRSASA